MAVDCREYEIYSPPAIFRFAKNLIEGLKAASLTGCSHNKPIVRVNKADFDTFSPDTGR
jgi:hypothetical protein